MTYPDGKKARITYSANKPIAVVLLDADESAVYKAAYAFSGDRLVSVTEYGWKTARLCRARNRPTPTRRGRGERS